MLKATTNDDPARSRSRGSFDTVLKRILHTAVYTDWGKRFHRLDTEHENASLQSVPCAIGTHITVLVRSLNIAMLRQNQKLVDLLFQPLPIKHGIRDGAFSKVKRRQRLGTEAIRTQIQPSKPIREVTNITNSQNTKGTYCQPSEQLFHKRWPLSNRNRTKNNQSPLVYHHDNMSV